LPLNNGKGSFVRLVVGKNTDAPNARNAGKVSRLMNLNNDADAMLMLRICNEG
jgi:hypothetical protein